MKTLQRSQVGRFCNHCEDLFGCPCFTGSCDFEEKSFCSWLNVPNGNKSLGLDDFDWTLGSGSTPSWQTGPSTDHTTGSSLGMSTLLKRIMRKGPSYESST